MIPRRSLLTTVWKGTRSVFVAGSNNNAIPPYSLEDVTPTDALPASDALPAPEREACPATPSVPASHASPVRKLEDPRSLTRHGFGERPPGAQSSSTTVSTSSAEADFSLSRQYERLGNAATGKEREILSGQLPMVNKSQVAAGVQQPVTQDYSQPKLQLGLAGFPRTEASMPGMGNATLSTPGKGGVAHQSDMARGTVVDSSVPSSGLSSVHAACQGTRARGDAHRVMNSGLPAVKPFHGLPHQGGSSREEPVSSRLNSEVPLADEVGMSGLTPFRGGGGNRSQIATPDFRALQLLSINEPPGCSSAGIPPVPLHHRHPGSLVSNPMPVPMLPFMHFPVPVPHSYPPPHIVLNQTANQMAQSTTLCTPASPAPSWQAARLNTGARHHHHQISNPEARQSLPLPVPLPGTGTGLICYLPQPGFDMHAHAPPATNSGRLASVQSNHSFFVNNNSLDMVGLAGPQLMSPHPGFGSASAPSYSYGDATRRGDALPCVLQGRTVNQGLLIEPSSQNLFQGRGSRMAVQEAIIEQVMRRPEMELLQEKLNTLGSVASPSGGWAELTTPDYHMARKRKKLLSGSKGLKKECDNSRMVDMICDTLISTAKTGELTAERIGQLLKLKRPMKSFEICQVLKTTADLPVALPFFQWCKLQRGYKPDVFVYTTMIGLTGITRDGKLMQSLYDEMLDHGIQPTRVTLNRLLYGYGRAGFLDKATEVFEELNSNFGGADSVSYHTMIDIYSKTGKVQKAEDTFRQMQERGFPPTVVAYGQLMWMYGSAEEMAKAERCFRKMKEAGLAPNEVVYNIMINLYGKLGRADMVIVMVDEMLNAGLNPDVLTYTTLMNQFGKQGRVADAERIFDLMLSRRSNKDKADNIAFTAMIDIFAKEGEMENAFRCFRKMLELGIRPHNVTYNVLLNLFVKRGDFLGMRQVFETMVKMKLTPCLPTFTLLLSVCSPSLSCDATEIVMSLLPEAHPHAHSLLQALVASLPTSQRASVSSLPLPPSRYQPAITSELNHCQIPGSSRATSSTTAVRTTYSRSLAHGLDVQYVSSMVDNVVAKQNFEHLRGFFDAMVHFLWLCGRPTLAGVIWNEAEARQVYPFFLDLDASLWRVDLHCMSTKTAAVALTSALLGFQDRLRAGQVAPNKVMIVTGWGKRSRIYGESTLKQTIEDMLASLRSPFTVDMENTGTHIGDGKAVKQWLLRPETSEMLVLEDPPQ